MSQRVRSPAAVAAQQEVGKEVQAARGLHAAAMKRTGNDAHDVNGVS